jgi:hypothetical protein
MYKPLAAVSSKRSSDRTSPDKMYKSLPKLQLKSEMFEAALDQERTE